MRGGLLLLAASLFLPVLRADHEDFVVVSATASKAYTQRRMADGSPQRQSYVFYQGRYFGGAARDPSIDRATFLAIARTLAPDLAKQNFFPVRGPAPGANLLLIVNWGTTVVDPSLDKNDMEFQSRVAPNESLGMEMAMANSAQQEIRYDSQLLGYDASLRRESNMSWATPDGINDIQRSHLSELMNERYFVIILAYDFQKMQREDASRDARRRAGPAAQPQPVWEVRMNIQTAGNNFNQALPAMSAVAADYFGKQMDDLVTAQAAVGSNAHVDIGEAKTINVIK